MSMKLILPIVGFVLILSSCGSDDCQADPKCTFQRFLSLMNDQNCDEAVLLLCPEDRQTILSSPPCSGSALANLQLNSWQVIVDPNTGRTSNVDSYENNIQSDLGVYVQVAGAPEFDIIRMVQHSNKWYLDFDHGNCWPGEECCFQNDGQID